MCTLIAVGVRMWPNRSTHASGTLYMHILSNFGFFICFQTCGKSLGARKPSLAPIGEQLLAQNTCLAQLRKQRSELFWTKISHIKFEDEVLENCLRGTETSPCKAPIDFGNRTDGIGQVNLENCLTNYNPKTDLMLIS